MADYRLYGYAKHGNQHKLHKYRTVDAERTLCGIARTRLYHPMNVDPERAARCRRCAAIAGGVSVNRICLPGDWRPEADADCDPTLFGGEQARPIGNCNCPACERARRTT